MGHYGWQWPIAIYAVSVVMAWHRWPVGLLDGNKWSEDGFSDSYVSVTKVSVYVEWQRQWFDLDKDWASTGLLWPKYSKHQWIHCLISPNIYAGWTPWYSKEEEDYGDDKDFSCMKRFKSEGLPWTYRWRKELDFELSCKNSSRKDMELYLFSELLIRELSRYWCATMIVVQICKYIYHSTVC